MKRLILSLGLLTLGITACSKSNDSMEQVEARGLVGSKWEYTEEERSTGKHSTEYATISFSSTNTFTIEWNNVMRYSGNTGTSRRQESKDDNGKQTGEYVFNNGMIIFQNFSMSGDKNIIRAVGRLSEDARRITISITEEDQDKELVVFNRVN